MSLENLPIELKALILHHLSDFTNLRNVVHAVPSCHPAYLFSRRTILCRVLSRQLPPEILLSAMAVQKAARLPKDAARLIHVRNFITQHGNDILSLSRGSTGAESSMTNELSQWPEADMISLANMHSIVTSMTQMYGILIEAHDPLADKPVPRWQRIPLSRVETHRMHRACYRIQMFCNLFSDVIDADDHPDFNPLRLAASDLAPAFMMIFEPWQGEEIVCMCAFLHGWYLSCVELCRRRVPAAKNFPWKEGTVGGSMGGVFFPTSDPRTRQIERFLKLGLPFFHSVSPPVDRTSFGETWVAMLDRTDCKKIWKALEPHMLPWDARPLKFLEGTICTEPYNTYSSNSPHAATVQYAPDDPAHRNLVWTQRGPPAAQHRMRSWGYVFWDFERLASWHFFDPNHNRVQVAQLLGFVEMVRAGLDPVASAWRRLRPRLDPFAAWRRSEADDRLIFVFWTYVAAGFAVYVCLLKYESFRTASIFGGVAMAFMLFLVGVSTRDNVHRFLQRLAGGIRYDY